MAATYLLAMRCPVYKRRDSNLGFGRELGNLLGDVKGKGTSGRTARPKVPMRPTGADCFVVAVKRSNARGAKGAGHPVGTNLWVNCTSGRTLLVSAEGGSLRWVARAG